MGFRRLPVHHASTIDYPIDTCHNNTTMGRKTESQHKAARTRAENAERQRQENSHLIAETVGKNAMSLIYGLC